MCLRPQAFGSKSKVEASIGRILISTEEIEAKVAELGARLARDYQGRRPLLVALLKGSVIFLADLVRHIQLPLEMDFIAVASYGQATASSGAVRILMDLATDIAGRDVLIVEDIVDTGRTLEYILRHLWARHPSSLRICTLLDKPSRREVEVPLDYVGFTIPNAFVVGYGLDYGERYRNLPYIAVMKA